MCTFFRTPSTLIKRVLTPNLAELGHIWCNTDWKPDTTQIDRSLLFFLVPVSLLQVPNARAVIEYAKPNYLENTANRSQLRILYR